MNKYPYFLDIKNYDKFKIKSTYIHKNFKRYEMLNYDKSVLCFNDHKNSVFKNIIVSYPEKKVLSVMPPKTMNFNLFLSQFPSMKTNLISHYEVSEFIEGSIINLFFDDRLNKWLLVTKYPNTRKGYIMKEHSSLYKEFVKLMKGDENMNINKLQIIENFQKKRSYNFKIQNNILYIIEVFHVENLQNASVLTRLSRDHVTNELHDLNGIINLPKQFFFSNYYEFIEKVDNSNFFPNKFIITHISGYQTHFNTSDCEFINKYKSVNQNIQYLYLCFKKMNKQFNYTDLFPRFKSNFIQMETLFCDFINKVHQAYIHYYIKKDDDYKDVYLFWAHKIHKEIYIPSLKISKIKIHKEVIRNYFTSMHPRELLFVLQNCCEKIDFQTKVF